MGYDTMFCMARTEEGGGEVDVEEDVEEDDEEDDEEDNDEDANNNDDGADSAFLLSFTATSCSCFIINRS